MTSLRKTTLTPPPLGLEPAAASSEPPTGLKPEVGVPFTASSYPGGPTPRRNPFSLLFDIGQLVAGRYQVLRFLARGGMGEVYEALDLDLGERIALKTLSGDYAYSEEALQRFKRELSLARKVTHPNVSRTYDFFQHTDAEGRKVACLSMELLQGETLAQRLQREGRLAPELVLNLAQQMASALEAAHLVGVIHRDLKPSNVMLVRGSSGEGSLRAVVTDFGLAFSVETREPATGRFLGTPAYMSPEQVEDRPLTAQSDIYSLGLVIFELVTGHPAFQGSNPISTATKRLTEPAPSPLLLVPDLEPLWEEILGKCLARDPEDRYPSASALRAALEPELRPLQPAPRRRGHRALVAAAAALLFGGGAMAAWSARGLVFGSRTLAQTHVRPTLAVLGFRNLGPQDAAWRGTALAEMLATELGLDEKLRLVPGDEVARMKADLGVREDSPLDGEQLARIRKNLGSDLVVAGSFLDTGEGGTFRLDLRLLDARSGAVLCTLKEEGRDREILNVVHGAGLRLRERLGMGAGPADAGTRLQAAFPRDAEGLRLYSEALEKLRRYEARDAVLLLEQASAKDASCALVHSALSEAWTQQGYDDKAQAEAKTALDCAKGLGREELLRVEARHATSLRQWDRAAEAYGALFGFFPDNLDYGLSLVVARRKGDRLKEAHQVLERLAKLPSPLREDPRIDFEAALLAFHEGDYAKQKQLAERAEAAARKGGRLNLAGRARLAQARGHIWTGDAAKAQALLQANMDAVSALSDPFLRISYLMELGRVSMDSGQVREASSWVDEGAKLAAEIGSARHLAELNYLNLTYSRNA